MLKRIVLLLFAFTSLVASAQLKITDMPTHTGDPGSAWVPIVVGGVNKKVAASNFLLTTVRTTSSYTNPAWLATVDWSKLTGKPYLVGLDTFNLSTRAWRQKLADSLAALLGGYVTLSTVQNITGAKNFTKIGVNISGSSYVVDFNTRNILLGSDNATDGVRTNNTDKSSRWFVPHYMNGANPVTALLAGSTSTSNEVSFGGGTSLGHAATRLGFFTGSTTTSGAGTERWFINSSGNFLASADNTYDIGASGANRARDLYLARNATIGGTVNGLNIIGQNNITVGNIIYMNMVRTNTGGGFTDGAIVLTNNAGTDFSRLQFGGTTSSFPALKRSTTKLQVRLADDSGWGTLETGSLITNDDITAAGFKMTIGTIGSTSTLPSSGYTYQITAASGNITITLPPAGNVIGKIYVLKRIDGSGNTLTIDGDGTETIDGAATKTLASQYSTVTIQSTGTQWIILNQF